MINFRVGFLLMSLSSLHNTAYTVEATIKNNGTVAGHEVRMNRIPMHIIYSTWPLQIPQLYVSPPASAGSPPYLLKGFDSIYLTPGEQQTVTFNLSRYDLSIWDVVTQTWRVPSGNTGVTVGASSRDRRLTGTISL